MKKENELALIVAFYISKYDKNGLKNLGYVTFNDAYRDIERKIGVKATSIKNRRDEFDPIHDNERVGWYQRPMSPSRVRIVDQFSSMSEQTLRGIALDIINKRGDVFEVMPNILKEISEKKYDRKGKFILRGPTGRRAEEIFLSSFNSNKTDFKGQLKDCRDMGLGYDFEITENAREQNFVEVKGLDGYTGGVVFTDKEWRTASIKGDMYYLVVVAGVSGNPKFYYLQNPAARLNPKRNINTSITVSWSVPQSQIMEKK